MMSSQREGDTVNVEELLRNVHVYTDVSAKAKDRLADRFAPDFNMFDYLRRNEMGVSSVIAFLLDPKANHGQRHIFLDLFCRKFAEGFEKHAEEKWEISTEKQTNDQRRIDIFLESRTCILAIENKPWAWDQKNQLLDYARYIEERRKNGWKLIYLGREGPTTDSIPIEKREQLKDEGRLLCATFEAVEKWLRECAQVCRAPNVRMFIEHFADFVRVNINNSLSMSEAKEMVDNILLKDEASIKSAFLVPPLLDDMKRILLEKLRDDLKSRFNERLLLDDEIEQKDWKRYLGFSVKLGGDGDDLCLRLEFQGSELGAPCWGIVSTSNDDPKSKESPRWITIKRIMDREFPNGGQSDGGWPWYANSGAGDLDSFIDRNWGIDPSPWVGIWNGKVAEAFAKLAVTVREALRKENALQLLRPDGDGNHPTPASGG